MSMRRRLALLVLAVAPALLGSLVVASADTSGIITTVAGTGTAAYAGDGGAATAAALNAPSGVLRDPTGNLYIADRANDRLRRVDSSGTIATVPVTVVTAGNQCGQLTAASVTLTSPWGLARDSAGNLFVSSQSQSLVYRIDPSGNVMCWAGTGTAGYNGDNARLNTELNGPTGLAVDGSDNLYIADTLNDRVRKVTKFGVISTVAGGGLPSAVPQNLGDNGPATLAVLNRPQGAGTDSSGNFYIADTGSNRIRKVDTNGVITTVAGSANSGYSGDGGPATRASMIAPRGVAFDAAGNMYIADTGNSVVRQVDGNGIITTVVGTGVPGYSGDGGQATAAQLQYPVALSVDRGGALEIADTGNNVVRRVGDSTVAAITSSGGGLYADRDAGGFAGLGGQLVAAPAVVAVPVSGQLSSPLYLGVGTDSNVYVRSTSQAWQPLSSSPVSCLDSVGAAVTTVAGLSTLTVACEGSDRALWYAHGTVSATALPTLSGWQSLGGVLGAGPAVATLGNTLTFLVTGSDGVVYSRDLIHGYTAMPWQCISHPALAARGSTAYFACHGGDGALWYAVNSGSAWGPAQSAGGAILDGPAIAAGRTQVSVYVEGGDGALWHVNLPPGGTGPVPPFVADGGTLQFGPGATTLTP